MLKSRSDLNLAQKAVGIVPSSRAGLHHFQSDGPIVPPVGGTIHDRHGASPDLGLQVDAALGEAGAKCGGNLRHKIGFCKCLGCDVHLSRAKCRACPPSHLRAMPRFRCGHAGANWETVPAHTRFRGPDLSTPAQ
jgi:hypothetical protein